MGSKRLLGNSMLWLVAISAVGGIGAGILTSFVADWTEDYRAPVVAGLQAPRGLTPLGDGSLLIAEVLGGRILRLTPEGDLDTLQEGLPATLGGPGGNYPTGVSAAVLVEDACYYVVGEFRGSRYSAFYRSAPGGEPDLLAGGTGPGGFPASRLTNPYDLVALPGGGFLASDSGLNAVLYISQDGTIAEYAAFPRRELAASGGSYSFDVVPTGLTIGPDGAVYLASLTGYPYPQGAARIYRLEDLNGDGDALDQDEVTVLAQGFSAATDLAFDSDGSLLVTEFSTDMARLINESGIEEAANVPGRLLRWSEGETKVVAEGLVSPTAVAIVGGRTVVSEEFAGRVTEVGGSRLPESLAVAIPVAVGLSAAVAVLFLLTWWRRKRPRSSGPI